jgi:hypothetical protein
LYWCPARCQPPSNGACSGVRRHGLAVEVGLARTKVATGLKGSSLLLA